MFSFVVMVVVAVIISVMMQGHRIELLEWIGQFTTGSGKVAIKRDTLHFVCTDVESLVDP